MFKKLLLISILSFIPSCRLFLQPMPKTWDWGLKARPLTGVRGFPEADTDYGKGFKSGCTQAFREVGRTLDDILPERIDPDMIGGSSEYSIGWFDGEEQCTYIIDHDVI